MPRQAKPYKERGWWVSRPFGEYWRFCPESKSFEKAKEILDEQLLERAKEKELCGGTNPPNLSVAELFALFLEAVETEKSRSTFRDYQLWCNRFAKIHGQSLARDVKKIDAEQFKLGILRGSWVRNKQPAKPYKPKTVNHAIIALRRAFNWGIKNELLPPNRNPFANIELLAWEGRKRIATEDEYRRLLNACGEDEFRDVLVAMRFTSARPGDVRTLTWADIQWDRQRWVMHKHKTSQTTEKPKPRIIGMNAIVETMLRKRAEKANANGTYGMNERVFLNSKYLPWSRNALVLRMRRLRRKAEIKPDSNGEE